LLQPRKGLEDMTKTILNQNLRKYWNYL